APVVDLNTGSAGINDSNLYFENDTAGSGIGVDIAVSDVDNATLQGARVTIGNAQAGDELFASLPLPRGITVDSANSTPTTLVLTGAASASAYAAALGQVGYRSSSDNP